MDSSLEIWCKVLHLWHQISAQSRLDFMSAIDGLRCWRKEDRDDCKAARQELAGLEATQNGTFPHDQLSP